jgi:aconitate hydratase
LALKPGDLIAINAPAKGLVARGRVTVEIQRAGGGRESLTATAAVETALDIAILSAGGIMPLILARAMSAEGLAAPADPRDNHDI